MKNTVFGLEQQLRRVGIWRADITEDIGQGKLEIQIPKNNKNKHRLERLFYYSMPATLIVTIIATDQINFKKRRKNTYRHTVILPGEIREIRVEGKFTYD